MKNDEASLVDYDEIPARKSNDNEDKLALNTFFMRAAQNVEGLSLLCRFLKGV